MKSRPLVQRIARFMTREDGPTAVEYAVMLALIIVVCISAVQALGGNAAATFLLAANASGSSSGSGPGDGNYTGNYGGVMSISGDSFNWDNGFTTGTLTPTGGGNYTFSANTGSGTAVQTGNSITFTATSGFVPVSGEVFTKN